ACQVECPTGALDVGEHVRIRENCSACGSCLDLRGEACLAARSLASGAGGASVNDIAQSGSLKEYRRFGMRKAWLAEFLRCPEDWASHNRLGPDQSEAMMMWLRDAELATGNRKSFTVTELGRRLLRRGSEDLVTWAVIWTNLARNSTIVKWYATAVRWGAVMTKAELVARIGETYPRSEKSRRNSMTALLGLLTQTPLGSQLGLGEPTLPDRRTRGTVYKKGWQTPDPTAVLYALYRYAEKTGRYELTVHELYEDADEGPYALFGISQDTLKAILRGLSLRNEGLVRVSIVRDLDNVFLDSTRKSVEVLLLV
ncbi:MAG: hypothetical protein AB1700_12920, partial [Bacillota bacterium]